jgi:hypothetical protein
MAAAISFLHTSCSLLYLMEYYLVHKSLAVCQKSVPESHMQISQSALYFFSFHCVNTSSCPLHSSPTVPELWYLPSCLIKINSLAGNSLPHYTGKNATATHAWWTQDCLMSISIGGAYCVVCPVYSWYSRWASLVLAIEVLSFPQGIHSKMFSGCLTNT